MDCGEFCSMGPVLDMVYDNGYTRIPDEGSTALASLQENMADVSIDQVVCDI